MDSPFASSLTAAPAKRRIAWIVNERGRRNIWAADTETTIPRQITSFSDDDGQDIADLNWSPDANTLLFARGGDFENEGENPNPAIALVKPDQSIWSASFNSDKAIKLAEGREPAFSPDGRIIAFLRKGQLFFMHADGKDCQSLLVVKGSVSGLRWSPDGRFLAFTNLRNDHSFVALYSVADRKLSYLDPTTDRDSEVSWSPDSTRLAYLRLPTEPQVNGPRRLGQPWSIRIYDLTLQKSTEVFRADPGPGSVFHDAVAENQIFWTSREIVFPWEKTGWLHLYGLALESGTVRELTPGSGEIEHVALSPDRTTLVFSSNIAALGSADADRRHLSKLTLAKQALPEPVTAGD